MLYDENGNAIPEPGDLGQSRPTADVRTTPAPSELTYLSSNPWAEGRDYYGNVRPNPNTGRVSEGGPTVVNPPKSREEPAALGPMLAGKGRTREPISAEDRKYYEKPLQRAATFAEGAMRGATFGQYDPVMEWVVGPEFARESQTRAEVNPWTEELGNDAGVAAQIGMTGGFKPRIPNTPQVSTQEVLKRLYPGSPSVEEFVANANPGAIAAQAKPRSTWAAKAAEWRGTPGSPENNTQWRAEQMHKGRLAAAEEAAFARPRGNEVPAHNRTAETGISSPQAARRLAGAKTRADQYAQTDVGSQQYGISTTYPAAGVPSRVALSPAQQHEALRRGSVIEPARRIPWFRRSPLTWDTEEQLAADAALNKTESMGR